METAKGCGKDFRKAKILDVCCGSRMFWFNRRHPDAIYMDNRELDTTLCDGRKLVVAPDLIADFRNIPFEDDSFYLVIFDPPHLISAGDRSFLALKYGKLGRDWREDLRKGFSECFRVLKPNGTLIFKWSEVQVPLKEVLKLTDRTPIIGDQREKKHWLVFMN